jgi:hypothetical protein
VLHTVQRELGLAPLGGATRLRHGAAQRTGLRSGTLNTLLADARVFR